jgi:molybdopterin synthase sulfur carrier subunit
MGVKVRIPTPLRRLTSGVGEVQAQGKDVAGLIEDLDRRYPGLRERLCEETGELRRFINVYVNQEDVRFLSGQATALKDGDEVSIVPAIAGGC